MKLKLISVAIIFIAISLYVISCKKDSSNGSNTPTSSLDLPATPYVYGSFASQQDYIATLGRVQAMSYYGPLFNAAFNSPEITVNKISQALATFVSDIKSQNTKFDAYLNGGGTLSGLEDQGRLLFFDKYNCNSCHQTTVPV